MQIITTPDGRAIEYDGEQAPLPALPVDATVYAYQTPNGLWVGVQEPGKPRPVYAGSGGEKLGSIELEADAAAVFDAEKRRALQRINDGYDAAIESLVSSYPSREVDTFTKQEREAVEWLIDSSASTPFIDGLLVTRNIDKADLVSRIIAKADAFAGATGQLTGRRQTLEAQVENAGTIDEVKAIQW